MGWNGWLLGCFFYWLLWVIGRRPICASPLTSLKTFQFHSASLPLFFWCPSEESSLCFPLFFNWFWLKRSEMWLNGWELGSLSHNHSSRNIKLMKLILMKGAALQQPFNPFTSLFKKSSFLSFLFDSRELNKNVL